SQAHLEGSLLADARLERASLERANVEGAPSYDAHLEGAGLVGAHLVGANLREEWLDARTVLNDALLDTNTHLGDIHWSGVDSVNLTSVRWDAMTQLGDEKGVHWRSETAAHERVVRAHRQLAAQLRPQGMSEVADRFLYRGQIRQRGVLL